ncbi:hypothetical protein GIB67_028501 [Kingdonia uniflora]|uniref:Uncharacterized protein n=1 Tax=Kingdonia uniflora TaxID=39325 RepID=A0A7J7NHJ0_9MAGN|nr:hypothetical protein GIB67_028501 [Kingdonia uniflora]
MEHFIKFTLLLSLVFLFNVSLAEEYNTYIIHMDKSTMPDHFTTQHDWYMFTLSTLPAVDGVAPIHLYTYNHVMDGFSAVMSKSQLDEVEKIQGHVATYPETFGQALTTRSSQFLGLRKHSGLWQGGELGKDMIIGIIDTGIWPESESFNDHGMPPVPARWRGRCETGVEFNSSHCNRKLIGARSFSQGMKKLHLNISTTDDYDSPRDFLGHGTHTSSTAAGNRVRDVDSYGYAKGTATGVAPLAHLAMYKVVFLNDTYDSAASDVLKGMDQAIEDGVDLMSLSLGFFEFPYYKNPIAIGAFAAMEKGAGTIDRDYAAHVTLGEGVVTITGKSAYPEDLFVSGVPIYYGNGNTSKEKCQYLSLNPEDTAGKIVYCKCDNVSNVEAVIYEMERIQAYGAIFSTDSAQFMRLSYFSSPFVAISLTQGDLVEKYLKASGDSAKVDIKFQITLLGVKPAPQVADFSSRGPSRISPTILKPDILAPGVNILAAWVPNRGRMPIGYGDDMLLTDYAILSGTSMASPHGVGVAALLKAAHHDWSSAAIRSAMMTTADIIDNANGAIIDIITGISGTPLDYGAGQVNPNKAMDPGLVYDVEADDYVNFLCGLNYTSQQIAVITKRSNYSCDKATLDLNYPSFILILEENSNTTSRTFKRVLTNVAESNSVYIAVLLQPNTMKVVVEPMTLTFAGKQSKAEFSVSVDIDLGGFRTEGDYYGDHGYISWYEVNGKHVVRSPIVSAFAA